MKINCPNCEAVFNAPDEYKGKKGKCPKCQHTFTISTPESNTHKNTVEPKTANRPSNFIPARYFLAPKIINGILQSIGILLTFLFAYVICSKDGNDFHFYGFLLALILIGISVLTAIIIKIAQHVLSDPSQVKPKPVSLPILLLLPVGIFLLFVLILYLRAAF